MRRSHKPIWVLLPSLVAGLLASGVLASSASAGPAWEFNGTALTGSEAILGHDVESSLTLPGLTTTCKPFVFQMTISNSPGTGKGSLTSMPLSNCFTNSKSCVVEAIEAKALPWTAVLKSVGGKNYLVIEGFKLSIVYAGELCALGGVEVIVKGSAGGLIDNATESVTFSPSSFTATGTSLGSAEWNGGFTMIATGSHVGQSLAVL